MKRFALLLVAAPLVLAACGGSSNAQVKLDPVAYVKHAAQKTAATSEHMTMTVKMNLGPMSMSIGGSGDFSSSPLKGSFALHMAFFGQSIQMQEVLDGTTIYMGSPLFAKDMGGKKWVKLDLAELGKVQGFDMTSLMTRNPAHAIEQLKAAGTVTKVGTETIDGAATTKYRVTNLDISKLPQGAKIKALGHPKYGPIDVWIGDANGYIYRETMSIGFTPAASSGMGGQSVKMTMVVNLSKFGEAVHVTIPPASETGDATNLPGFGS